MKRREKKKKREPVERGAALPSTACGENGSLYTGASHSTSLLRWPTISWRTSSPEAQGMDSSLITETMDTLFKQKVHSMVIVRKGSLVTEAYTGEAKEEDLQDMRSVTKSITSALVGVALSEGYIGSVDQRVADFFPELSEDPVKSRITLKHLLTMTSGLYWNNDNEQSSNEMMYSPNWIKYILECPVTREPGTAFNYSNGDAHLLSAIIHKATGQSLLDYAQSRLFKPLGITNVSWNHDPQGFTIGAWALALSVRDMAKVGLLYLKKGQWAGQTVLPERWVKRSLSKSVLQNYTDGTQGGYGFFWWLKRMTFHNSKKYDVFYAAGSAGKRIFVVPDLQLIVAMTADSPDASMPELLLHEIIRAVKSNGALPESQSIRINAAAGSI